LKGNTMAEKEPAEVISERPIQTVYYRGKQILRVNNAKWPNSAVLRCVDSMQLNKYGATTAEVFDNTTGELHAVVTHSVVGKIQIIFKREVTKEMGYVKSKS
jgi:hypothetical protein